MESLCASMYQNIVILTGAGISVASGIRPFRGPGGLWESGEFEPPDMEMMQHKPQEVWNIFGPLRQKIAQKTPNLAHEVLARFEKRLSSEQNFTLITQNIDGFHQKAGSQNVIEIHGSLSKTSCTSCDLEPYLDTKTHQEKFPLCINCNEPLRPAVVLFGENLPVKAEWNVKQALRDCDLFLAIGTSGTVSPASNYVRSAEYVGARTIFVNLEKMNPRNRAFKEEYLGKAEEILPKLLA